jgi:hypothetical protein
VLELVDCLAGAFAAENQAVRLEFLKQIEVQERAIFRG